MIFKNSTQVGNPMIRAKAKPVKDSTSKKTQKVVRDLIDSMRHHGLVGMAAPQIGSGLRIFVTEMRKTKHRSPRHTDIVRVFINPKIISFSKHTISGYEGCGSVAGAHLFGKVARSTSVTVRAQDRQGKKIELKATGLLARIIQHEQDHLDGIVFLDRLTEKKSLMSDTEYRKKFKK